MFLQVQKAIHNHSSSWSGMAAFETAFTNFKEQVVELNNLSYEHNLVIQGVSNSKDAVRLKTITKAMEIVGIMRAFASTSDNEELKVKLHITPTSMGKASKLNLVQLIDLILEKSTMHFDELVEYGITQAKIDLLQVLRDEVQVAVNTPRSAIIARRSLTLSIEERVIELDKVLREQLDMMVEALKNEHPKFYKDYKGARVIIDSGVKKKANTGEQFLPAKPDPETPNTNTMF